MITNINISCESDLYDCHRFDKSVIIEKHLLFFDTPVCFRIEIMNQYIGLSDIVPAARSICDTIVEATVDPTKDNKQCVSCRKGCTACCSYLVPVSIAEVYRLQSEFLLMPADERIPILKSCVDAASKILKNCIPSMDIGTDINLKQMSDWYDSLQIQCPFLSHGMCRIYEQRPLACREYFVTSPPDWCRSGQASEPKILRLPVSILESLGTIVAHVESSEIQAVIFPLALIGTKEFSTYSRHTWPAIQMVNQFFDTIEQTALKNAEIHAGPS